MNAKEKILVVRTDRLGDVLTSLPTLEYLRNTLSGWDIDFLTRPDFEGLLAPFLSSRNIGVAKRNKPFSIYKGVLFLNYDPNLFLKAFVSKIKVRCGARSKPLSVLLNHGIRQARSLAEFPEAKYSLGLAETFVEALTEKKIPQGQYSVELGGTELAKEKAEAALEKLGIPVGSPFAVLHPGMGGSALNLSVNGYIDVAASIESLFRVPLLLSEGPLIEDHDMVARIAEGHPVAGILKGASLEVLREVFRRATVVVAPSTGPLHLAHYVGTRTIGLFPPVRSQHPKRWAPWGGRGQGIYYLPKVDCPATRDCIGKQCKEYFCMDNVAWGGLILGGQGDLTGPGE